jgi:TonB C terminal
LSLDAPPDWRQAALPRGANAGNIIGGDGENGGGSGCGSAGAYLTIITSQLRNVFTRNEKTDGRRFQAQAQLWFDDLGGVQRSQLVRSTGNADLDATVTKLLKEINVGRGMPRCVQPIAVWVSQPWTGVFSGADNKPVTPSHVEVWRTFRRP